jgi:hypothetical protein
MSGMGRPKRGGGVDALIALWLLFVIVPIILIVSAIR